MRQATHGQARRLSPRGVEHALATGERLRAPPSGCRTTVRQVLKSPAPLWRSLSSANRSLRATPLGLRLRESVRRRHPHRTQLDHCRPDCRSPATLVPGRPSQPDPAPGSAPPGLCSPLPRPRRRPHQTASLRRWRRTAGRSTESTMSPRGTIQKPSTGRNPTRPPRTSATPSPIRTRREAGRGIRLPAKVTYGSFMTPYMGSHWRAPTLARGWLLIAVLDNFSRHIIQHQARAA